MSDTVAMKHNKEKHFPGTLQMHRVGGLKVRLNLPYFHCYDPARLRFCWVSSIGTYLCPRTRSGLCGAKKVKFYIWGGG